MDTIAPHFCGDEGVRLARDVIDRLADLKLPTTPQHYELWSAHLAGIHPGLSADLNAALQAGNSNLAEVARALFARHFGHVRLSTEVLQASEFVARELAAAADTLRSACDHCGAYSRALEGAVAAIETGVDPGAFRALMAGVAAATREMAQRNRGLSQRMETSSRQVEALVRMEE
jgi:diguanylate cyclase